MGLFSSSKKVYVASTVYNMNDDAETAARPTYMQQAITGATLSKKDVFLGQSIVDAHLKGPRSSQRAFFRWAKSNFDFGMPRAAINYTEVIDHAVVASHIHTNFLAGDPDTTVDVSIAFIGSADEAYYAEQHILENRPELIEVDWAADYDADSGDIWIQYPEGTEYPTGTPLASESITIAGFNTSKTVMVAYYTSDNSVTLVSEPSKMFIYEIGDGVAAFDNYRVEVEDGANAREFYPFIPLRIDNKSVFQSGSPARAKQTEIEDAYSKGVGGDINDLVSEINSNPDIGDIDYAYVVFGVCLNTSSKYGQRYVFEFLQTLSDLQQTTSGDYTSYQTVNNNAGYHPTFSNNSFASQILNSRAFNEILNQGSIGGTSSATTTQAAQINEVHLTLPSNDLGVLDIKISWSDIKRTVHTGVIRQGAKVGEAIVDSGTVYNETGEIPIIGSATISITTPIGTVRARKQISPTEYVQIEARGLHHQNLIYEGKSVDITGHEALADSDDSGFVLPLHEPTLRRMGVVAATEVARDSFLIIFNSYKVVKKKWYQKGIFKIFAVVIIITAIVVAAVVTGGASLGPSAPILGGVLGSSVAIGASLGFSGLLALAVGTAINVLAGMIITALITEVAVAVLGEKLGRIIATVISVVVSFGTGPNGFSFSNIGNNIASLAHIDKLLLLTNAGADLANMHNTNKIEKINLKLEEAKEDHEEELDRLKEMWDSFGFGDRVIDPIMLTDFSSVLNQQMGDNFIISPNLLESPDSFISRTLMTGDDLAELSLTMVNDFVDATLTLT